MERFNAQAPMVVLSLQSSTERHMLDLVGMYDWTSEVVMTFPTGYIDNAGGIELRSWKTAIWYGTSRLALGSIVTFTDWLAYLYDTGSSVPETELVFMKELRAGVAFFG